MHLDWSRMPEVIRDAEVIQKSAIRYLYVLNIFPTDECLENRFFIGLVSMFEIVHLTKQISFLDRAQSQARPVNRLRLVQDSGPEISKVGMNKS